MSHILTDGMDYSGFSLGMACGILSYRWYRPCAFLLRVNFLRLELECDIRSHSSSMLVTQTKTRPKILLYHSYGSFTNRLIECHSTPTNVQSSTFATTFYILDRFPSPSPDSRRSQAQEVFSKALKDYDVGSPTRNGTWRRAEKMVRCTTYGQATRRERGAKKGRQL